jgi:hypothetical protein
MFHQLPIRREMNEIKYAVDAVPNQSNDVEFTGLDRCFLAFSVDLRGDVDFVAVFAILQDKEEAGHETAEETSDVRQRVIVFLEGTLDGQGET